MYDKNGDRINDDCRSLNFTYNVLNLLSEVKAGSIVKAKYSYLTNGTKLRVRDGSGVNVFDYTCSLTYKKNSAGFNWKRRVLMVGIRASVSGGGGTEVNYFLTDHLGSVRVIVDSLGRVLERNDYYAFGAGHVRSDYPRQVGNRFKYNGQEEQVTGDLGFLDYGWRMHDKSLGRWFSMDRLSEMMPSVSCYSYVVNNPVRYRDLLGLAPGDGDGIAFSIMDPNEVVVKPSGNSANMFCYAWLSRGNLNKHEYIDFGNLIHDLENFTYRVKSSERQLQETISWIDRNFNGGLGLASLGLTGFNKIPQSTLRHYSYEFTRKMNKITGSKSLKSGGLYQGTKRLMGKFGRNVGKLGKVGTVVSGGVIGYEIATDQWDAHTIVNGVLLVGGVFASIFAAPAVLIGIGVYGVTDLMFDVSGTIDNAVGRNSGIWD